MSFIVMEQNAHKTLKSSKLNYELKVALVENRFKDLMVPKELYETIQIGDEGLLIMKEGYLG